MSRRPCPYGYSNGAGKGMGKGAGDGRGYGKAGGKGVGKDIGIFQTRAVPRPGIFLGPGNIVLLDIGEVWSLQCDSCRRVLRGCFPNDILELSGGSSSSSKEESSSEAAPRQTERVGSCDYLSAD